jgi:outer membrane protein, heavy metal efflux system
MKSLLKNILFSMLSLTYILNTSAQSAIDAVLAEIAANNKTLQAHAQYLDARNIAFRTGLAPADPVVTYDFLSGKNSGNQHDISVTQSLDFPVTYYKKSQLAKEQSAASAYRQDAVRQDILLEAKHICIALVYHHQRQQLLERRKSATDKLLKDFLQKLDKGDGNILDVNKARVQLISIEKAFKDNLSEITQLQQKLLELNGGNDIIFSDTLYPAIPDIEPFEMLEQTYEINDPHRKILEQERIIADKALAVSKANWWPKMELGYLYEGKTDQTFNGFRTGISIPLWANRNTLKLRQAEITVSASMLDAHINEHYYHLLHMYEKYENLKHTLTRYEEVFTTMDNHITLLDKALALGQITSVEYFLELSWFNDTYDEYLKTGKEYQEIVAALYKYTL